MKIHLTEVKSYEFEGSLSDDRLMDKYLKLLEIDPNREFCDDIKVTGEFSIDWDDDIGTPMIEYVVFSNGNKEVEVDFKDLDLEDLEEQITDKDDVGSWYEDRISGQADDAMDYYKDNYD